MKKHFKLKICKACGNEFEPNSGVQLYCSSEACAKQQIRDQFVRRDKIKGKNRARRYYLRHIDYIKSKSLVNYRIRNFGQHICPCGVGFTAWRPNQTFHSKKCQERHWVERSKETQFKKNDKRTRDLVIKGLIAQSKITSNKFHNTSIEHTLAESLRKNNISSFEQNTFIGRICPDIIFRDKKVAVFCDGDYWHKRTANIEKDKRINSILRKRHWKVLRFWEWEIKTNSKTCAQKILEAIGGDAK